MAPKKKTARKVTKRVVKKAAQKTVKKGTARKATKKAVPKKVATKKVAKKAPKKVVKKAAKKAPKKAPKKAVAKKAPKKAAKKVAKKAVARPPKKAAKKATPKGGAKTAAPKAVKRTAQQAIIRKPVTLKGFAKKQYQKLLDLRDDILDAMYGVTHDQLKNTDGMETGGGGMHTGDAGSDSYDRDFALNLLAKEQDALNEIEQAITRAESGVYGICEMSGDRIPKERLEAIPFARYTVQCQARWEQENNHLRNNGSSDFGFSNGNTR